MAPTATTSTASGTPTAMPIDTTPTLSSGFAGEEFINNLGSDLAPLLTLFGEQVTKQFLSMSLGWADHILLAVGPLGIITTVVSAVRVSNVRVLKAIIGRAREKLATAELELLSSTSDATSELWTEEGIVRQPGHATILEMVAYKSKSAKMASSQDGTQLEALSDTRMGDLSEAYNVGVLSPAQAGRSRRFKALAGKFESIFRSASSIPSQTGTLKDLTRLHEDIAMKNARIAEAEARLDELAERIEIDLLTERTGSNAEKDAWSQKPHHLDGKTYMGRSITDLMIAEKDTMVDIAQRLVRKLANQPPNLILNVHNTFPRSGELWALVMIGVALQLVAMAIPAIMTYHWRQPKGSNPVQDYAYPTFLLGTCLLVVSIALCSYIIEATTVEQVFTPTVGYVVENIFRLQVQQNIGDQPFKAYVILNHAEDKKIRTSRYDPDETIENDDQHNRTAGMQDDSSESGTQGGSSESSSYDSPMSRRDSVLRLSTDRTGKSSTIAQKSMVIVAVILCFVGFVCQFVGLRALHWSATVIQLGITLLMTCIRAWVRRGISNQPITFQLPDSDPNWIALSLGTACRNGWPPKKKPWPTKIAPVFQLCNSVPETRSVPVTGMISNDDPRIRLRRKLLSLSTTDDDLLPQAQALLSSMHELVTSFQPRNKSRSRPITWSHIVLSSGLTDSSLQSSRLKLTMSFNYDPFRESEQKVLNRNTLHALLSILRYKNGSPPRSHCVVARVKSTEDWIRKGEFLVANLKHATTDESYYHISYLSTTGHIFNYHQGNMERNPLWRDCDFFGGMSIEDMQPATETSTVGNNSSYGYLLVTKRTMTNHVSELLAGFMDGVCHEMKPKYDPVMKSWYVDFEGSSAWIEPELIVDKFKASQLAITEMEASLLVVSSLARCTVWKESVLADEPDPASVPLPKPSPRAAFQRPLYQQPSSHQSSGSL